MGDRPPRALARARGIDSPSSPETPAMGIRPALRWLLILPFCFLAACGTEPDPTPQPPAGLQPPNDTPQNTILRFIAAYEGGKTAEYRALFTGDFKFEFSNSSDPTLANRWPEGWPAADESISASNLHHGGTNLDGVYQQKATSIDLIFSMTQPVGDNEGRDQTKFQVLSTPMDGVFVMPAEPPSTEPIHYYIVNNSHRFYLVRGDAAVGLTATQPADSTHWYIWGWNDETTGSPGAPTAWRGATIPATWGKVKGLYR
jgi:hypothetical protein